MKTDVHWQKIGFYPHHGICLPLSALHTTKNCGIGEFLDLIPLIDWCKSLKLDVLQLLPLNDSGHDPSPYNPLSSCALDPIYLNLSQLGIRYTPFAPSRMGAWQKKLALLRVHFTQTFPALSKTAVYQSFIQQNPWLEPYSHFKALKEVLGEKGWMDWPSPTPTIPRTSIDFYSFLQFHCFHQMETVRAHATKQKVFIKGDIPILLSLDSADVWSERTFFNLDLEAGAPPDDYNQLGQKWGFPLFNWEVARKNDFIWWKQRLKVAERLFHLYRIDHVVGFFRIWGISKDKKPIEGSFFPPDSTLWPIQGKELLTMMLNATPLLPIAEDLGTIPEEVYPILKELGICGTKVMRWQKRDGHFLSFNQYEPYSMTTVSTPDIPTLALWWTQYPKDSAALAAFMHLAYHPLLTHKERLEILRASHHTSSIFHINLLQEYLGLFPELVASNPAEERINTVDKALPTNWTYRFRPSIEEIINHKGLQEAFDQILDSPTSTPL